MTASIAIALLAGGYGTRMGQVTQALPKHLLQVGDKTLLEHAFEKVAALRGGEIHVFRGFRADLIDAVVRDLARKWDVDPRFHDAEANFGPWHSICLASDKTDSDVILAIAPDIFCPALDVAQVIGPVMQGEADVIIAAAPSPPIERAAILELDGTRIVSWTRKAENAATDLVNVGCYAIHRRVLLGLRQMGLKTYLEDEVHPALITQFRAQAHVVNATSFNINRQLDLDRARAAAGLGVACVD